MFDVGFAELFLLSLIGLLVLGPERLPAVARTLGGALRKARTSWHALKRTIESELSAAEASSPLQGVREDVDDLRQQVRDLGQEVERAAETPGLRPDGGPGRKADRKAGRKPDQEPKPEAERQAAREAGNPSQVGPESRPEGRHEEGRPRPPAAEDSAS